MHKITISQKDLVPPFVIKSTFNDINSTYLSFGVHEEDDGKHENRDRLAKEPLHKALYKNSAKMGNAQLLRRLSNGFSFNLHIGRKVFGMQAPPRPILEPMIDKIMRTYGFDYVENELEEQLSFKNKKGLNKAFKSIAKGLSTEHIKLFVRSEYSSGNNKYTAGVKQNESRNGGRKIKGIYNSTTQTINFANNWTGFDGSGDTPLIDSEDLIKSIKTKVGE